MQKMIRIGLLLVLALLVGVIIISAQSDPTVVVSAPTTTDAVFIPASVQPSARAIESATLPALRQRVVDLNLPLMTPRPVHDGTTKLDLSERVPTALTLNLFDDHIYTATRVEITARAIGTGYVWHGTLLEEPLGDVTLVVADDRIEGSVSIPGRRFIITHVTGSTHEIIEVNPDDFLPPAFIVPNPPISRVSSDVTVAGLTSDVQSATTRADVGNPFIDLLVVFSPQAATAAGSEAAMVQEIEAQIATINTGFRNSAINMRLRLVAAEQITYNDNGSTDMATDLDRLRLPSDGNLDAALVLREQYGADLVTYVRANTDGATCGQSYVLGTPAISGSPWLDDFGLSVSARSCFASYFMAHVVGHNLGSQHNVDNANPLVPPNKAYGYGYQATDNSFRTIMALNCDSPSCPVINRWSNPSQVLNGKVLGTFGDGTADNPQTNNVLSINQNASEVAVFRNVILPNNFYHGALAATVLPYTNTQDQYLDRATEVGDPDLSSCGLGNFSNSVWYQYTPPSNIGVRVSTLGSSYDTILAVFDDAPTNGTPIACNDDGTVDNTSEVVFTGLAGKTYYIMVGKFGAISLASNASLTVNITSYTPQDVNLLTNGAFATDLSNWSFFGAISSEWVNGAAEIYRTGWAQPSMFQQVNLGVPNNAVLQGVVTLTNISDVPKTIQLQVRTSDFSAQFACSATIDAGETTQLVAQNLTTQEWSNMLFSIRNYDRDNLAAVRVDNASLQWLTGTNITSLRCSGADPDSGENYLLNGDFSYSGQRYWSWSGGITTDLTTELLRFYRNVSSSSAVIFTKIAQYFPKDTDLQLRVELNNTSGVAKDVRLFLRESNWAQSQSCDYTIPAGESRALVIRITTDFIWSEATIVLQDLNPDGLGWLELDNATMGPATGADMSQPCITEPDVNQAPQNINLINNSEFNVNLSGWSFFGDIARTWDNGGALIYRTSWTRPTMFQTINRTLPTDAVLEANVNIFNESSVPKTVLLNVRKQNFNQQMYCAVTVGAGQALNLRLRDVTTEPWSNIVYSILTFDRDNIGDIRIDNATLVWRTDLNVTDTDCAGWNPTQGTNYLLNGDLSFNGWRYWTRFGDIVGEIANQELRFYRNTNDQGVVFTNVYQYFQPNANLAMSFDLGNTSNVTKDVLVFLREGNWAQNVKCEFTLAPGEQRAVTMRITTNQTWGYSIVSMQPLNNDSAEWMTVDNVTVGRYANPGVACSSVAASTSLALASTADFSALFPPPYFAGETGEFRFNQSADQYALDCDADGVADVESDSGSLACAFPAAGTYTLTGTVTTGDDSSSSTTTVTVLSLAEGLDYIAGEIALQEADGLLDAATSAALSDALAELETALVAQDVATAFSALEQLSTLAPADIAALANRLTYAAMP